MSKRKCIIIQLFPYSIIIVQHSIAFEVDLLRSGMSKAQVNSIIKSFSIIGGEGDTIIAQKDSNSRFYSLSFCNDKLVQVQKDLDPSVKDIIIIFDQFTSLYGKPTDSKTRIYRTESYGMFFTLYRFFGYWILKLLILIIPYFPKMRHFHWLLKQKIAVFRLFNLIFLSI